MDDDETMTDAEMAANVSRGAALLDRKYPGWAARVMPDRLDMRDCHLCVLGQRFREYTAGLGLLGMRGDADAQRLHGFDAFADADDPAWRELERLWSEQIEARVFPATEVR